MPAELFIGCPKKQSMCLPIGKFVFIFKMAGDDSGNYLGATERRGGGEDNNIIKSSIGARAGRGEITYDSFKTRGKNNKSLSICGWIPVWLVTNRVSTEHLYSECMLLLSTHATKSSLIMKLYMDSSKTR